MPSIRSWWLRLPQVRAALTRAADPTNPLSERCERFYCKSNGSRSAAAGARRWRPIEARHATGLIPEPLAKTGDDDETPSHHPRKASAP